MSDPFGDWRYRWSRLARIHIIDSDCWIVILDDDMDYRMWHWWSPADLVRMAFHKSWSQRWF